MSRPRGILLCALMGMTALASARGAQTDLPIERALRRLGASAVQSTGPWSNEPLGNPEAIEHRTYLAIARSIVTVESELDTVLAVLNGDVLPLISLARNYRHLGARTRALEWYQRASIADRRGAYREEILAEIVDTATEIGDSTHLTTLGLEIARGPRALERSALIGKLLAALANREVGSPVLEIVDGLEGLAGEADPNCVLEMAEIRTRNGQHDRAVLLHAALIRRYEDIPLPTLSAALRGLADGLLVMGDEHYAAELYERYRQHDLGTLSAWSTFQLGNIAAADARFQSAIGHFRSLCERESDTPWREEACQRLAHMRRLHEIDQSLGSYERSLYLR